jgi:hypothetical protein
MMGRRRPVVGYVIGPSLAPRTWGVPGGPGHAPRKSRGPLGWRPIPASMGLAHAARAADATAT